VSDNLLKPPLDSTINRLTMTLNSRTQAALKIFLPLTFISMSLVAGELKANAKDLSTVQPASAQTASSPVVSNGAVLLGQPSIDIQQNAVVQEFSSNFASTLAQSTPSTPSDTAPSRAVPGSTPSGTPTNPANVTPSTTTPSTTPETTTPTTPSTTPTTPSTTPTSPDTTTPAAPSVTPITPDTTPSTTPGTTPTQELSPGRSTRSGSSYVGVGGNIGIGNGDIPLGRGSFAIISKIGLTRDFSVRPSVLFSDDVAILLPITYDFRFGEGPTSGFGFSAAPYLGLGAAISTGGGSSVGLLLTGGIDVPISSQFTATAAVNASVTGQSAVGILLGVGYNFAGF